MEHLGKERAVSVCGFDFSIFWVTHGLTPLWWNVTCPDCERTKEYRETIDQFSLLRYRFTHPIFLLSPGWTFHWRPHFVVDLSIKARMIYLDGV